MFLAKGNTHILDEISRSFFFTCNWKVAEENTKNCRLVLGGCFLETKSRILETRSQCLSLLELNRDTNSHLTSLVFRLNDLCSSCKIQRVNYIGCTITKSFFQPIPSRKLTSLVETPLFLVGFSWQSINIAKETPDLWREVIAMNFEIFVLCDEIFSLWDYCDK